MKQVEEKIQQLFYEKMSIPYEQFMPEANLKKDIGLDSLDAVEIMMEIEKEFDIHIPDEQAESFRTIGDIILFVKKEIVSDKRSIGSNSKQGNA